jgi:F0F1-type ATP synthase assembly protein I
MDKKELGFALKVIFTSMGIVAGIVFFAIAFQSLGFGYLMLSTVTLALPLVYWKSLYKSIS